MPSASPEEANDGLRKFTRRFRDLQIKVLKLALDKLKA
jgi:hypothetical protein